MVSNGFKWFQMVPNGAKQCQMVQNDGSDYNPIQAGSQKNSTDGSVCFPIVLESSENYLESLGKSKKLALYWL